MTVRHKDQTMMAKQSTLKLFRAHVRAKHSILADEELNELLPQIEEAMNKQLMAGKEYHLDIASLFEEDGES